MQIQEQKQNYSNPVKKIASIDTAHEAMIHDAQYDYYGKLLATCSSDGKINIFDVTKPDNIQRKAVISNQAQNGTGHNGPVWQCAWAHPRYGTILASCGFDKKVIIWSFINNKWESIYLYEHQGSVNGIAWAPWEFGLKLAACSSDGSISIHSKKQEEYLFNNQPYVMQNAHDMGINAISWAPYSSYAELSNENFKTNQLPSLKLASASCDNTIKIWEFNQNKNQLELKKKLDKHKEWVRDVAWCPSIGNSYDLIASCSEDQSVILWKIDKKNVDQIDAQELKKFQGPVWRVSWSQGGNMLAVSSASSNSDNVVHIFNDNGLGQWEEIQVIDNNENAQI